MQVPTLILWVAVLVFDIQDIFISWPLHTAFLWQSKFLPNALNIVNLSIVTQVLQELLGFVASLWKLLNFVDKREAVVADGFGNI